MARRRSSDAPEVMPCGLFPYLQKKRRELAEVFSLCLYRWLSPVEDLSYVVLVAMKEKISYRLRENARREGVGAGRLRIWVMGWGTFPHDISWPASHEHM